jgi:catechol 2,3-dioxygenase-like lactoylglutathione lyase family enzyme
MVRGIDHIVHAVHDLDAATALYRALGFQVGARNTHAPSWGTRNHIVQLGGSFIELLTVAEPAGIVPHGPRSFSFGAHNRDALARGEGLSMLVLEGRDALADARAFHDAGIGNFDVFDFEREARRPDGTPIKVAFSLAFASDPAAPDIGFFTCQHRFPENFWNPEFQIHFNTAVGIAGVVLVAKKPSDHYRFLTSFSGADEVATSTSGLSVATPRGEIQVMDPVSFQRNLGEKPLDTRRGAQLAAMRIAVRNLGVTGAVLHGSNLNAREYMGKLIVGPETAMGATLVFEPLRTA